MALILLGAAYQDSDKQQAAKYLKLALKAADDPTIALQGLANCVENTELPDIYDKLLKLTPYVIVNWLKSDLWINFVLLLFSDKYRDLHQKLLNVSEKLESVDACLDVFQKEKDSENSDRSSSAYECITQIALRVTEFDNKWNDMVLEALEQSVSDQLTPNHKEKSKALLRHLYRLKYNDKLIQRACDVADIYPEDSTALEWVCKIYVDKIDDDSFDIQVKVYCLFDQTLIKKKTLK